MAHLIAYLCINCLLQERICHHIVHVFGNSAHEDISSTWKDGWAVPVVTQSPREAYPMGGLGLQKVSPRSELRMLVSMMAPAGPTAGGWLLQIWTNVVVRARGLQRNTVSRSSDTYKNCSVSPIKQLSVRTSCAGPEDMRWYRHSLWECMIPHRLWHLIMRK